MKIKEWVLKNRWLILIGIVIMVGVFFRSYRFADWLHFELDQSRDAKVIDLAIKEGPSNLPLLGPRAGGTYLRLGPFFYYMEYLSALVFGDTPEGMARAVWVFGIFSLPLFYYFCRQYFDKKISVILLALFSFSLYLIVYSRFAWNPNPLPFFVILISLSLLKLSDKDEKRKGWWLAALIGSLAVAAQLHFLGMIVLSIYAVAFLLYSRPKVAVKKWIAGILLGIALISPMIINDVQTKGANTKEFFKAITKKSNKHDGNIVKKVYTNYAEHASKYLLILSGKEDGSLIKLKFKKNSSNIFKAKFQHKKLNSWQVAYQIFSMTLFAFGAYVLFRKTWKEKDAKKKNFLVSISLFFIISFGVFTPLSLFLSPRFFLPCIMIPFIMLGLIFEFMNELPWLRKWSIFIAVAITSVFLVTNSINIYKFFQDSKNAMTQAIDIDTEMIISERTRLTLEQQRTIDGYIEEFHRSNGYPIYIKSEAQYQRAFLYHLLKKNLPAKGFRDSSGRVIYRNGNYFVIFVTLTDHEKRLKSFLDTFDLAETKQFGSMTLFRLTPKEAFIGGQVENFGAKIEKVNENTPRRYKWEEIFDEKDE